MVWSRCAPILTLTRLRMISRAPCRAKRAVANNASPTNVGTLWLGSTRSYTCSMKNEPVSIRILMTPLITPRLTNTLLHDSRAARIVGWSGFASSATPSGQTALFGLPFTIPAKSSCANRWPMKANPVSKAS